MRQPGICRARVASRLFGATVLVAAGFFFARGNVAAANEAELKSAVAEMLDVGWGPSFRVLGDAEGHFDRAHGLAAGDHRVPYAFALVQIKHRRYSEARRLLRETLELSPRNLPARQAKVWVAVVTRKYAEALADLEALAEAMHPKPAKGRKAGANQKDDAETARFLGRIFGFLEGPAAAAVRAESRSEHQETVLGRLTTVEQQAFDEGRKAVLERFDELALHHEQSEADAKSQQEAEKEHVRERLEGQQAAVENEKASVDDQAAAARQDVDATLSEIEKKQAPLDESHSRLVAEARPLQAEIADLDLEISRLLDLADRTRDALDRDSYFREADRLSDLRRGYAVELQQLDADAAEINGQRAALQEQRNAAIGAYERSMQRLGRQAVNLRKTEKRISSEQQQAARPSSGKSTRTRSLAARVLAFTTYQEFPLEKEKQRVLGSFAAKR